MEAYQSPLKARISKSPCHPLSTYDSFSCLHYPRLPNAGQHRQAQLDEAAFGAGGSS